MLTPKMVLAACLIVAVFGVGSAAGQVPGANGHIVFSSDRDGNYEIYLMNADGSGQARLTNNTAIDETPSFSPDGKQIVFTSDRDGNYEIYLMNADGSGQTRLTNSPKLDYAPSFSPDGKQIVFTSGRDGNYEIYVMNADGSTQTRLTNNTTFDEAPSFSPDGKQIALAVERSYSFEIYVMNADGTDVRNLTNSPAANHAPDWSPDGRQLVFQSYRDGTFQIWTVNADGTGLKQHTRGAFDCREPRFSPDGRSVASIETRSHRTSSSASGATETISRSSTVTRKCRHSPGAVMRWPFNLISPSTGFRKPPMLLSSVDFPAPFGPSKATACPHCAPTRERCCPRPSAAACCALRSYSPASSPGSSR